MPTPVLAALCAVVIFAPFVKWALPALLVRRKAGVAASTIGLVIGVGALIAIHRLHRLLYPPGWDNGIMTCSHPDEEV